MGSGSGYKAGRARARVLMREIAREMLFLSHEVEKADRYIALGAGIEMAGDYQSAIQHYSAANRIASGLANLTRNSSYYSGLAEAVEKAINESQMGVVECELKKMVGYKSSQARKQ